MTCHKKCMHKIQTYCSYPCGRKVSPSRPGACKTLGSGPGAPSQVHPVLPEPLRQGPGLSSISENWPCYSLPWVVEGIPPHCAHMEGGLLSTGRRQELGLTAPRGPWCSSWGVPAPWPLISDLCIQRTQQPAMAMGDRGMDPIAEARGQPGRTASPGFTPTPWHCRASRVPSRATLACAWTA